MSGSVDGAKDTKDALKPAQRPSVRTAAKASAEPKPSLNKPSTDTLLKDAVTGVEPKSQVAPAKPLGSILGGQQARYAAVAVGAMAIGTAFGMLAAPKPQATESLVGIQSMLDANRAEAGRINSEVEKLGRTLAALRETTDAARAESRTHGSSVYERLSTLEHGFDKKLAGLAETIEKSERDQTAKLVAQAEKRAAVPVPAPAPVAALPSIKPEPTTTGSIAEAKPKPETIESWAVRDVYAGIAMLEDRKRRLVEVGPGDQIPGIGRVEAVERRGRTWVVVTKQGLITPQSW